MRRENNHMISCFKNLVMCQKIFISDAYRSSKKFYYVSHILGSPVHAVDDLSAKLYLV